MAPIPAINLLLTGFQGWGSIGTNPAELIGKKLNGAILNLHPKNGNASAGPPVNGNESSTGSDVVRADYTTSATISFQPLRVSYRDVEKQVPAMHESGEWDCIVHLGVRPSRSVCTIETGSNTSGYVWEDVDGAFAPQLAESRGVAGDEPRWESTLDCEKCCQELNAAGFDQVQLSDDPGSFLCGYTTALSLKCANDQRRNADAPGSISPIPVVFFHVPFLKEDDPTKPYTLNELTQVVRALCTFAARQALKDKLQEHRITQ